MSDHHQQSNPLLSPPFFVIPGISPSAPISTQVQQIDQLNTLTLQEIDANFAKFHQIITAKILPEIKRFAIGAEPIRETSLFWRSFFEAAAATRLGLNNESSHLAPSHQSTYEDETVTIRHDDSYLSQAQQDGSFMFQPPVSSTPLPGRVMAQDRSWEDSMESPFDKMDRKLEEELRWDKGYAESSHAPTPSLPSGYSLPAFSAADASYDVSTGTVDPPDLPRVTSQSSRPKDTEGTPKAKRPEPNSKFNGLVDLRHTPLNAKFAKPSYKGKSAANPKPSLPASIADLSLDDSDDDIAATMSPPVTMTFTLPPRAQAILNTGKTPKKGQADPVVEKQRTNDNALSIIADLEEEMGSFDSPRMPTPKEFGRYSVVPEEMEGARRLFQDAATANGAGPSKLRQTSTRKSLANTSYGSDIIDYPSDQPTPIDGDEDSFDDDDDSFDSMGQTMQPGQAAQPYNDQLDDSVDMSYDHERNGGDPFGQPQQAGQQMDRFNLMKLDEMDTIRGGKLEDGALGPHHSPTYPQGNRR